MPSLFISFAIFTIAGAQYSLHGNTTGRIHTYSTFSYTALTTTRYATPLPSPLVISTPFAPAYSQASTLLPSNVTYTTYSLDPNASGQDDGPYGQSAYAALWADLSYSRAPPFTTTIEPTPIPSSELVFPPRFYNSPGDDTGYMFPSEFIWGAAGSAWQIEGGLQVEGRGPSVLDAIGALPNAAGYDDANIADMNYFLYKHDIARLAALGVPHYSFSIPWSRVVPFGVTGSPINIQALEHYDKLIDTCIEYGVTPVVTMNHADPPTSISFDSPDLEEHFLYYAKQVMTRYSDRVPIWVTFNEPNLQINLLFETYNAFTNVLIAHAKTYNWYKDELKGTGQVTIKFGLLSAMPRNTSDATDVAAANRHQDFILAMLYPLFLGQQYPSSVLDTPGVNLTGLTDAQLQYINSTADFLALDPYSAQYVYPASGGIEACAANASDPLWPYCSEVTNVQSDGWLMGDPSNDYCYIAPQYVRQQLGYVWNVFKPSGILMTEFGFNQMNDSLRNVNAQRYDLERTLYYQDYLNEVLKAVHEDGINMLGAIAWSLMDNNEFGSLANQYGMQYIDRTSERLERRYKRSFFDFVDFFQQHVAGR